MASVAGLRWSPYGGQLHQSDRTAFAGEGFIELTVGLRRWLNCDAMGHRSDWSGQ